MKIVYKFLIVFLAIISLLAVVQNNNVLAAIIDTDDYKPPAILTSDSDDFAKMVGTIIKAFQVLGSLVCVVALMIIGIKYMMGSVDEKAEYKERLVPYIIGAIMVFAIPTIVQIIYDASIALIS